MLGFTTSFIIDIFFVFLLYQTECVGLFKLYTGATVVTYYTITSFLLVREIFCEVCQGMQKIPFKFLKFLIIYSAERVS